jgi:hypothetical protein
MPFIVGIALATLFFVLFGLDLAHHWVPELLPEYEPSVGAIAKDALLLGRLQLFPVPDSTTSPKADDLDR